MTEQAKETIELKDSERHFYPPIGLSVFATNRSDQVVNRFSYAAALAFFAAMSSASHFGQKSCLPER